LITNDSKKTSNFYNKIAIYYIEHNTHE
jgi:hypothetical protein